MRGQLGRMKIDLLTNMEEETRTLARKVEESAREMEGGIMLDTAMRELAQ
jgi:hypothetical protein